MTTNQTIDGVPGLRSLLERVTSQSLGMSAKKDRAEAAHELRALLDAPACKTCNGLGHVPDGEIYGSGGVEFENGPVECVKDCPACKPAAQHWVSRRLAYADSYRAMQRQGVETVSIWPVITDLERNIAPLHVEQPAPVALGTTSDKYRAELYDEVWQLARSMGFSNVTDALNTTRPTHANPPPGTEPSGTHHDNDGLDEWRNP